LVFSLFFFIFLWISPLFRFSRICHGRSPSFVRSFATSGSELCRRDGARKSSPLFQFRQTGPPARLDHSLRSRITSRWVVHSYLSGVPLSPLIFVVCICSGPSSSLSWFTAVVVAIHCAFFLSESSRQKNPPEFRSLSLSLPAVFSVWMLCVRYISPWLPSQSPSPFALPVFINCDLERHFHPTPFPCLKKKKNQNLPFLPSPLSTCHM